MGIKYKDEHWLSVQIGRYVLVWIDRKFQAICEADGDKINFYRLRDIPRLLTR